MKKKRFLFVLFFCICLSFKTGLLYGEQNKIKMFVVSSYHKEYLWSQATNEGLCAAMLRFGYLDNKKQIKEYTENDYVESSKTIIKKEWMNTKKKHSYQDIEDAVSRILKVIKEFSPDIIFLGDDNAANYIGNKLLDIDTPVVFWGINGLPTKYGIVNSIERPGHNITGVWQSGYLKESLEFLSRLVPDAENFAILACDSETSRSKVKALKRLSSEGKLPLRLVDIVITNSFDEFKKRAFILQDKVDAFFVLNHDTMVDHKGDHVDMMVVGRWYLNNIKKPEASHEGQFVREGMLCTANDSGYNQSYQAFEMALSILERGFSPATISLITPQRGPLMINRQRAEMLGISIEEKMYIIEEIVDKAMALK